MRGRICMFSVCLLSFIIFMGTTAIINAEGTDADAEKIERVRWSGITLLGLRMFGNWATAPAEPAIFGYTSSYFRLNGNDRTVFRGLGRENGFVQYVLPTLQSRERLRDIMSANESAKASLAKFDDQVATGEKIRMVSSGLIFTGRICVISGIVIGIIGIGEVSLGEDMPPMMKTGRDVAKVGIYSWVAGIAGQVIGEIVAKQAFSHLSDSMASYNGAQMKALSGSF